MPARFAALVASGRLVDLVLAAMLAEGVVLYLHHRRTGRGVPPADLAMNLLSGALLLLALRAALAGPAGLVPLWLTAALVAHLADLGRRWQR